MPSIAALQSTQLFSRAVNLTIGFPNDPSLAVDVPFNADNATGRDISGIDFQFTVTKSLKPTEPSTLDLHIYNLAPDTRQSFSGDHALTVRLEAGYKGALSQLFFAEARSAWTTRDGADYITHIESADTVARPTGVRKAKKGQVGAKQGHLYQTLGAKVPLATAFQNIATALGISQGNLTAALAGKKTSLSSINGAALTGNAAQRMTDLCRSAGLEWSVQDGALQLVNVGEALATQEAILIRTDTGMVESPSVDSQGALTVKTLLIPGLAPGVQVKVDSLFVEGVYRIEKIRYVGDTRGTDWYAEFDAVRRT